MRKERRMRQENTGRNSVYLGIIFLVLAIICGLAYFAVFEVTPLQLVNQFQYYFMGKFSFLLPLVFLFLGWISIFSASTGVFNKRTVIVLLLMLCLLGTAHHILIPIKEELYPDQVTVGAGFVGGFVAWVLHNFLGESGTEIFLLVCWFLILLVIMPWKKLYGYIKNTFFTSKDKTLSNDNVSIVKQSGIMSKSVNKAPVIKTDSTSNSIRNVYNGSEFDSFQDGLKKQSTFKRILSLNDDNIYEQEPVKEDVQRNPVQVPEWVESQAQQVIIRPKISYGDEPVSAHNRHFLEDKEISSESHYEEIINDDEDEVAKLFVNNTYIKQDDCNDDPIITPSKKESIFSDVEYSSENNREDFQEDKSIGTKGSVDSKMTFSGVGSASYAREEHQRKVAIYDSAEKINSCPGNESMDQETKQEGRDYKLPPLELLNMPQVAPSSSYEKDIMQQCAVLEQTLADFRVKAKVIAVTRGPSVTRFELEPAPGVKVSSVVNLADDIALRLAAPGVRIEAPIPGKSAIGIEAPNTKNDTVCFREVVDNNQVHSSSSSLCIGLGKDISGNIIPADLSKMPHLLVAGSTGAGKSVCINTIIAGILYKARPEDVKLILVDPKVVELSNYNGIPHLLTPVVTEPKKAASALHWAVAEMERRYQTFADNHVRDINSYNSQAEQKMPFIVIIIDELSDLMMVAKVDVEDAILRLAQKARAAGIHLILATQRPSVDVITGIVKANIPSRIAFAVSSQTDSRTIIDMGGAEKLLGKGDMLFYPIGMNKPVRVQGAFVSDAELNRVVDFIIKQSIPVNYSEEVTEQELECDGRNSVQEESGSSSIPAEDELFEDAVKLVLDMGQASSSMLQRRFRIGYTRAARLVDTMEELGIVGQAVGSKPREVIMSRQEVEERFLNQE